MKMNAMLTFTSSSSSSTTLSEHSNTVENIDMARLVRSETWFQQPLVILVVGASGDLAKKKTYPALFELWRAQLLPAETLLWGFARTRKTHDQLRQHLRPTLVKSVASTAEEETVVDEFLQHCFYASGHGYGDAAALSGILRDCPDRHNLLLYLSIPPHVFAEATRAVQTARATNLNTHANGFCRVILEKPFGHDTDSCDALLQSLRNQQWRETDLFRIDHYLGKEMVQNILILRQHNAWLERLWNYETIESVHLLFKEPFGTEGRGGYFDEYGILRDILQNHLLQVLTLVAMELPEKMTNENIRTAKVNVIQNMSKLLTADVLVGQYRGYTDDETIENKDTTCPTYACVRCCVNTERWRGVPFVMEAGKALDERVCQVQLNFRGGQQNSLVLRLQPSPAIYFTTNIKTPGFTKTPVTTRLGTEYSAETPDAYTRLILDVLRNDSASFVRDDELRAAWELFTPLLRALATTVPDEYEYGSTGPVRRAQFLRNVGMVQECNTTLTSAL